MAKPTYSVADRERAELYALRVAVIELLASINELKFGIIDALKQKTIGGNVKPQPDFLPVKDKLLRERLLALLQEAE